MPAGVLKVGAAVVGFYVGEGTLDDTVNNTHIYIYIHTYIQIKIKSLSCYLTDVNPFNGISNIQKELCL